MNSVTDQTLLADYAERHSEAAFSELVSRHIDLVHSAALRMVRDSHLAEDVTQSVFIALARSAKQLSDRSVLSGWLHRTAQNLAANAVRSEVRRRAREQEAATMNELLSATPKASWEEITPHLDTGLGHLSEPDRDAVLLRYFEKRSAQEMAEVLGVTAEAAQRRVSRAMERLREFLVRRGVSVSAGGLVGAISTNAVQAAPTGLATAVCSAATLSGTLTATATATATKAIAMTTLQKALVTATVAALAGVGIYEARQAAHLRAQLSVLEQQQAPLAEEVRQLERDRDEARRQLAAIRREKQQLQDNTAELLRLRGMAGVARRATEEAAQLRAQLARLASEAANNPVTGAMADAIKQALERRVDSRLARMTVSLNLTPEQAQAVREILTRQAQAMSAGMQQAMSGKYNKEELTDLSKKAGNADEQIKALLTPDQLAAFPTVQQEEAAHTAGQSASQEVLEMRSNLGLTAEQMDRVYPALYEVSYNQILGGSKQEFADEGEAMQWALDQKAKALEPLLTESQLANYRQQQAVQVKLVKDILEKMKGSRDAQKPGAE